MNQLDKFYSSFQGLDTRSNKLLQPQGSFRKGTKNNRYNFLDEITNANGFQHKDSGAPTFVDIFEYKYRNVNTGASEIQTLGVATNGHLYRKLDATLSFTAHGAATSVSIYYDEVADTFKCSMNGLGSVNISDTMTLAQLETALELLAGVTITITGTSSLKAYLLDCVINDTTFADNKVYYWERVPYPDIVCVAGSSVTEANLDMTDTNQYTFSSVPFKVTLEAQTDATIADSYDGISSVNLNNSIYISDGGFPMKYDGKAVYRAGLPKQIQSVFYTTYNLTGIRYVGTLTPASLTRLPTGTYLYKARFGFTDYNGATNYGDIIELGSQVSPPALSPGAVYIIESKGIYYGQDFPSFCAIVNGDQATGVAGGTVTVTVDTGHNILPGMVVRQLTQTAAVGVTPSTVNTFINFYAKVTAVTATTITLQETVDSSNPTYNSQFYDNSVLQAYYVQSAYENLRPSSTDYNPPGMFLEIYRTKVNAPLGGYYLVTRMPVPHVQGTTSKIFDEKQDTSLTENFIDQDLGAELPRACKYLTKWQDQLVQAGYPADPTLKDDRYPSVSDPNTSTTYSQPAFDLYTYYTEAFICDFQSVYWADALTPEGFPQDGLHEFAIDTRFNDKVKAIAQNKDSLFALKERSTAILSGSVATNDVVMEVLESDAGCSSHRSVEEVRGSLIWLDGINGFYACVAGRLPENIGFSIQDYQKINSLGLDFSQASAANFRKESLYVCSVGTTTFVYDYADNGTLKRNCWYLWDRIDGKSVLATSDDKLLIWDGTKTWKMKTTNTVYDFTDHKSAISFVVNTAWASQGHPTIDKHYLNLWINSIQGDFTLTVKQYGNYLEDVVASQTSVSFLAESVKKFIKEPVKAYLPKLSSISFGMENAEKNKWVRIQGYEIQYSPDYNTGEPKR